MTQDSPFTRPSPYSEVGQNRIDTERVNALEQHIVQVAQELGFTIIHFHVGEDRSGDHPVHISVHFEQVAPPPPNPAFASAARQYFQRQGAKVVPTTDEASQ